MMTLVPAGKVRSVNDGANKLAASKTWRFKTK
jgi:hypothetical protein